MTPRRSFTKTQQSSKEDIEAIKKKGELQEPDALQLERLRHFFKRQIWDDSYDSFVERVQQRRNVIHAFKHRDIGTHDEFLADVRQYLNLLRYINGRLPYPDEMYVPREK